MESLLANYASSDEEVDVRPRPQPRPRGQSTDPSSEVGSSKTSLFASLPRAKSSSTVFSSLPQPVQQRRPTPTPLEEIDDLDNRNHNPKPLFSSLPPPKSDEPRQPFAGRPNSGSAPKRIIQIKPPINPISARVDDDDEDDDEEEEKEKNRRKEVESLGQAPSVKSFLSSIPAPRNSGPSLGVLPSSGTGRRAILETDVPPSSSVDFQANSEVGVNQSGGNYEFYGGHVSYESGVQSAENPAGYEGYGYYPSAVDQHLGTSGGGAYHGSYEDYVSYGNNDDYANCGSLGKSWNDESAGVAPEAPAMSGTELTVTGKRGRSDVPAEIMEVKQDDLMKNRPRQDQVRLTGIAFGPAYKPVSTAGKPTKLHKRKHQIGSLYYDLKQKEMELAERRARGILTKAETQAKYGW